MHWALDLHVAERSQAFLTAPPGINNPKIPAEFQKRFVQGKENNPRGTQGLAQPDPTTGLAGSHGWLSSPEEKSRAQTTPASTTTSDLFPDCDSEPAAHS